MTHGEITLLTYKKILAKLDKQECHLLLGKRPHTDDNEFKNKS